MSCGIGIICKLSKRVWERLQLDFAADYHLGVTWIWPVIMLPHHKLIPVINDPVAGLELTTF